MPSRVRSFAFALSLIAVPALAHAEDGDAGAASDAAAQAEARAEMQAGIEASDRADHEAALAHYRRAMQLVPEANLPHKRAAASLEALGRWDEALSEYETYLRIKPDVSDASAVRERVAEIRRDHVEGVVLLQCEPPRVIVEVDEAEMPIGEGGALRLARGPHRFTVRAPGHEPLVLDVEVTTGKTATPACRLTKKTVAPPPAPRPTAALPRRPDGDEPQPSPWYGKWWTWAGAGVLVAGATVVGILLVNGGGSAPPSTEGGSHSFP